MAISTDILRGFAAILAEQGFTSQALLQAAGVDEALLSGASREVSVETGVRVITAAYTLSRDPTLALRVSTRAPLRSLGVLGELISHCPTVRSGVTEASNYAHLVLPMAGLHLGESDDGEQARLVLDLPFTEPRMLRTATELALGFAVRLGRRYAPLGEGPSEVAVAYARPRYAEAYSEILRCPVRFGAARTQIVFPASRLDEPQLFVDDGLFCLLKVRADQQLAHTRTNLQMHERVRHVLRHQVDLSDITPSSVARRLGVTARKLRCCLALEGHSLQELIDETRREISLREILDFPIKGIADRVGFSQVGTFFRAFKRWTGTTPGRYRSQAATARLR